MTALMFNGLVTESGSGSGAGTGREGRENYAKNAKENQKIHKSFRDGFQNLERSFWLILFWFSFSLFLFSSFRVLRVIFAPFAAGNPLSPSKQPST
jgi:hypothetical protein